MKVIGTDPADPADPVDPQAASGIEKLRRWRRALSGDSILGWFRRWGRCTRGIAHCFGRRDSSVIRWC